jgi:hypothetical protein
MKYLDDVTEHPQRQSLQKRIEIIKFFENYGMEAYNPLTTNQAIVTMLINQAIDSLEE